MEILEREILEEYLEQGHRTWDEQNQSTRSEPLRAPRITEQGQRESDQQATVPRPRPNN